MQVQSGSSDEECIGDADGVEWGIKVRRRGRMRGSWQERVPAPPLLLHSL